jgi:hypothetical protein
MKKTQGKENCSSKDTGDSFPEFIQQCGAFRCRLWLTRHGATKNAPDSHYHCLHPTCFSRGILGTGPVFSTSGSYDVKRHLKAHEADEAKQVAKVREVWHLASTTSPSLNRVVDVKNQTTFRTLIDTQQTPAGSARSWESRLHIGKVDNTGACLAGAIERFGTCPLQAPACLLQHIHDPETVLPLPGHTLRFFPSEGDAKPWYGVCCGAFSIQDVLGEQGLACEILWFDETHDGPWGEGSATFYHLTKWRQLQLFACMENWGHLLLYDSESKLFVLPDDGEEADAQFEEWDQDQYGHPDNPAWREQLLESSAEDIDVSDEELLVFGAVFPQKYLHLVQTDGITPRSPDGCGADQISLGTCEWAPPFAGDLLKLPVHTSTGPIFLRPVRYYCKQHKQTVTTGARTTAEVDPYSMNVPFYRLGNMRYSAEALPGLQAMYVECLTVAGVRRSLLMRWLTEALSRIVSVKRMQVTMKLRTSMLQRGSRAIIALPDFLPSVESLTELQLVLFQQLVLPFVPRYDAAVAAYDGQLVRLDATFKSASVVLAKCPAIVTAANEDPKNKRADKKVYKKVAGCTLVAVGLEGLCLCAPRLAPSENNPSIRKLACDIMTARRSTLGSVSAPSAFVTDTIRRHKKVLKSALYEVYPEFRAGAEAETDEGGESDEDVLMLQDITHREWVFTKQVAQPKTHPDRVDYRMACKETFHQLRIPVPDTARGATWTERREKWSANKTELSRKVGGSTTTRGIRGHLRRGILESDLATPIDDKVTEQALLVLGNAGMFGLQDALGGYVPRRILVRAARRILMDDASIILCFPDHGYVDGNEFLAHIEGVNVFYKIVRSRTQGYTPGSVVARLATMPLNDKAVQRGDKRRKRGSGVSLVLQQDGDAVEEKGISDKPMVEEALIALHNPLVQKHVRTYSFGYLLFSVRMLLGIMVFLCMMQTLAGLMGQSKISGIQTDETIVEAVNKQLNVNVRQVQTILHTARSCLCTNCTLLSTSQRGPLATTSASCG